LKREEVQIVLSPHPEDKSTIGVWRYWSIGVIVKGDEFQEKNHLADCHQLLAAK